MLDPLKTIRRGKYLCIILSTKLGYEVFIYSPFLWVPLGEEAVGVVMMLILAQ